MDTNRLGEILSDCVAEGVDEDHPRDGVEVVDCHMQVPIDVEKAEQYRDELTSLLVDWPQESWGAKVPSLEEGPSYIHAGAVLDSQQLAFILFAVGKVLEFWDVVTPKTLGFEGDDAGAMAGQGMVMISGYNPVTA